MESGKGNGKPRFMGDILRDVSKTAPWGRRNERQALNEAWTDAVGEDVARCTRVVGLARGTLTVNVESAVLRHEIEAFRKSEILRRLRESCPAKRIVSLRCVLRA